MHDAPATAPTTKPLVYLILGVAGSGRREIIADLLADAFTPNDRPLVLLSDTEPDEQGADFQTAPSASPDRTDPSDQTDQSDSPKLNPQSTFRIPHSKIARWQWHVHAGSPEDLPGRIELAPAPAAGSVFTPPALQPFSPFPAATPTHIFFLTDGRRNPVDQIEAFKPWLASIGGELARVICVVNCRLASQHRELAAWYDACIHFSDIVLLSRRDDVSNKWISDFQSRYRDKFYPCLFEFVKAGRVRNPALILEPEARRMSHYFDAPDYTLPDGTAFEEGIDDEDSPQKRQSDDEIEIIEHPDEYLSRRAGGRRVKEIPNITKFPA